MDEDVAAPNEVFSLPAHTKQATKAIMLLLFFSFLMFTLPFGAYYGTKYCLEEYWHMSGYSTVVWSVLAAVVTVNFIILVYAYIAYHEQEYDDEGNPIEELKQD
ncbi:vacuolar ATPase assembly integral membrane protein VMA21-like [Tribolium madens]|uniref:vacuolar ATPase assembly integral membrane protein VMA21-like n=1 Tax=Tribolium madens TaxID=41895 RepID=UPI001CF73752|nr:vacuolar ATPase assembly integral membrane protein VMA21-like [Tribolium madens]XP_044265081.1 vacuolar ATPase assembly integral membrane protein VMA21-like [Tribolium madens]